MKPNTAGQRSEPGLVSRAIPDAAGAIPSIDLSTIYDPRFASDEIQYGSLGVLAELMGRSPIPHRHDDFLQIHFIESGEFELQLDTAHYSARGPALFLTPPATPHAFALSADTRGHVLTVRQNLAFATLQSDRELPDGSALQPFCAELTGEDGERLARELSACFELLFEELSQSPPGSQTVCRAMARTILAVSLRAPRQPRHDRVTPRRDLSHYRGFLRLVEEHFRAQWSVGQFADALGLTEWRLHEIVSLCGKTTPKAVVHQRILQEARRQLAFTNASIKEIAAWLGFADSPYFCRFFKRWLGLSPGAYRQQVLQSLQSEESPI